MGRVVAGVPVGQPVDDRDGVVTGHGQDEHQLLEVGQAVLAVPEGDRRRGHAGHLAAASCLVGAVHADRGGVVVQPRAVDRKPADHPGHQLGEQAAPVSQEEPVQHPPGPVVIEQPGLARGQAQQARLVLRPPLAQRIQRPVLSAQVCYHRAQHRRRVQRQPGVIGRDPAVQQPGRPVGQAKCVTSGSAPSRRLSSVNGAGPGILTVTSLTVDS